MELFFLDIVYLQIIFLCVGENLIQKIKVKLENNKSTT
ncbi:MAG: hypothetical protein ACI902_003068, partial [Psychroserpens sp.]